MFGVKGMFGERLRYLRECEELTQKELSEKLGISPSTLAHYESGRRDPGLDMLKKCANYFGVSVDYLLGNEDTKKIDKAISLRQELIKLMIQRGIIEDASDLNDEHIALIEMAIKTYRNKQ